MGNGLVLESGTHQELLADVNGVVIQPGRAQRRADREGRVPSVRGLDGLAVLCSTSACRG